MTPRTVGVPTTSPLRNRVVSELDAPVSDVWALVGNLDRFPEYSRGLERVLSNADAGGVPTDYVCHFKPMVEGADVIEHLELVLWCEEERGWASRSEEPNAFGLADSITLVTLEPTATGTKLTWDQHYRADDLETSKHVFDEALRDIGENLVNRFGGRVIERFVEP